MSGTSVSTSTGLDNAILAADSLAASAGTYTITLTSNITLAAQLEAINLQPGVTLDIVGNGYTIDGGGTDNGFFVYAGDVDIQNLTLADMTAVGGAGGGGGGGGGAGLGGALFIGSNVNGDAGNVILNDVSFTGDS